MSVSSLKTVSENGQGQNRMDLPHFNAAVRNHYHWTTAVRPGGGLAGVYKA